MIKFVCDVSADIPAEIAKEKGLKVFPFYVNYPDDSFLADIDLSPKAFYEKFKSREDLPSTSQTPPQLVEDTYRELGKENQIIHICIPANGSGTFQTAKNIADELNEEGFDITVIDSKCYSMGIGYHILKAVEMAEKGKTKEEIVDYLNHVYERDRAYFIVDDLTTLQKGGRIKATTMVITKLLDIKPILRTDNGKVEAFEKVKGLKKAISKMVNIAVENMADPENGEVVLLSNEADDKLEIAKKMVEEKLNPKKISTYDVGPIITCHAGMGVIGIFFEHKETEE